MYLLDTNVVSEFRKPRPHIAAVRWLEATPAAQLYLSAVTIGEIQTGIEIAREDDPAKAADIEVWLDAVRSTYRVLSVDADAFQEWARLMHRQSKALIQDALIASVAIVHSLTVVTRNVRDFKNFGVPILDPFKYKSNAYDSSAG